MNELQGLHILVTRPVQQAEPWADRLRAMGAKVNVISLLDIVSLQSPEEVQSIKNCVMNLDLYHKAIFVSQNAVEQGFEWIDRYWPQLPVRVNFFAIGEVTAQLLQSYGVTVTDLAQCQLGNMTSEALLQSPSLQKVDGEKIVIFRGQGGRTHLGDSLSARGARVDYCELYARQLPKDAQTKLAAHLAAASELQIVVLHSGETLDNFVSLLQQLAIDNEPKARDFYVLVPSERVLQAALAAGFKQVVAAANATEAGMLQALFDLKLKLSKEGLTL